MLEPSETEAGRAAEEAARAARREARASWSIRGFALGEEPGDDLSALTTADERLAMVWPLSALSWRLAGRAIPAYERRATPGRILRPRAPR